MDDLFAIGGEPAAGEKIRALAACAPVPDVNIPEVAAEGELAIAAPEEFLPRTGVFPTQLAGTRAGFLADVEKRVGLRVVPRTGIEPVSKV